MNIAKSRDNNTSVFNEWHLCNDQLEKDDVNRLKHWQMMFKFLSDREYALSQILRVHQFLCLLSNTLAEIQEQLFLFLHYYNLDNKQSQATKHTMHKDLIDYTQNEINIKLKKIYGEAVKTDILVRILFILSCLWDSVADNNPVLTIQFMYMKERDATVQVSSKNVLHWMRIIWNYVDDLYYFVLTSADSWHRWLWYTQIVNFSMQITKYMSDHIQTKIEKFFE